MTLKFGIKGWFVGILSILLLTDLAIFLNIPILRQVLAFLYFTIIPGLLILCILKLNRISFIKKFVLSIGLSIVFLMFVGLLLNQLYLAFGISKPLSTPSLVISFTFILIILAFIAYKRNKEDLDPSDILNIRFDLKKDQIISPVFFPILFPFLAVLGTHLMNTEGNNIILMIMLFLIPAYIAFIVYLRNRIPKITYPIAILAIATALLLMHGLTSYYLNGSDVHNEYYAFQIVGDNLYWSISNYQHVLTACLSTSLLPTIYWSLMGIDQLYVYKAVYQLIGAITPLVCYVLFKRYVDDLYAFLASIFFMAQITFIYGMQSAMRTELAIFFFALAMMVLFDSEMNILKKRILFLLFMFSTIVSHYTVCYVFFFMILAFWLVTDLLAFKSKYNVTNTQMTRTGIEKERTYKSKYHVTATVVVIFFALIFFWYSQVTATSFTDFTMYAENTFINLFNFFEEDMRSESLISTLTGTPRIDVLPNRITIVVYWVTFIFMIIGIMDLIRDYKNKKLNFELGFLLMILFAGAILLAQAFFPYIAKGYAANRLYQQTLVLLAFGFVIGGTAICKYVRHPKFSLVIITIVLILQFFCSTYVVHQVLGVPYSEDLNREGHLYSKYYIYGQDVISAKWLNEHNTEGLPIYAGHYSANSLKYGRESNKRPLVYTNFFIRNVTISKGYIYLTHTQVVEKQGWYKDIKYYNHLFVGKSKIYSNRCSEVYA